MKSLDGSRKEIYREQGADRQSDIDVCSRWRCADVFSFRLERKSSAESALACRTASLKALMGAY